MWRIRDVYPGSDFFPSRIPDPNCLHPGSRILIKEFKYFNPQKSKKMVSKLLKNLIRVVHPGSRIRMLTFSHPGSRIQGSKSTQSRIPDPDPQHCQHQCSRSETVCSGFRIRRSVPLYYGSGSRYFFLQWLSRCQKSFL